MSGDEGELKPGGSNELMYAYGWLTSFGVLILFALAAIGYAAYTGFIGTDIVIRADVQLGPIIEYGLWGLLGIILFWTYIQFARVAGVGFMNAMFDKIARIASNYEHPADREARLEESRKDE